MKGVVLAGTNSGVGKTVATLATLTAFEAAGYDPRPAKAGPDFIDPSHHRLVTGKPSRSLDPWLAGDEGTRRTYWRGTGDVCVVEGMMGLYDGSACSTARVAACLDLPVVLVVDASAGMESVAATALGFRAYTEHVAPDIDVVGVLAQRAHGGRHAEGIREALPEELIYFGRIPPLEDLSIPDRHLGLVMGDERTVDEDALATAAETVRVERLVEAMRPAAEPAGGVQGDPPADGTADGPTVAVARDSAFCFVYPSTVERLRAAGTVEQFSPVAGDPVPDADAVYLPGGYPERFGPTLAASATLEDLADEAADGVPIYGECGGFMALSESLTTVDGDCYEMAGVLPAAVEMRDRYQALDHVELCARSDTVTASTGECRRGHEFHYSEASLARDATLAFEVVRGEGVDGERDGLTEYRTLGTYAHCHAESGAFDAFLSASYD